MISNLHALLTARKHPGETKAKKAKAYGVNAITLRKRCRGITQPRSMARQEQQLLTAGEEKAVVHWCWCGRMSDPYFPVTLLMLISMTVAILRAHCTQAGKVVPDTN